MDDQDASDDHDASIGTTGGKRKREEPMDFDKNPATRAFGLRFSLGSDRNWKVQRTAKENSLETQEPMDFDKNPATEAFGLRFWLGPDHNWKAQRTVQGNPLENQGVSVATMNLLDTGEKKRHDGTMDHDAVDLTTCGDESSRSSKIPANSGNRRDKKWEDKFQLLVEYKGKHKTTKVSMTEDPVLKNWVRTQRSNFEKMSNYRKQKLNSIGFIWKTWNDMYNRLAAYHKVHGNTRVSRKDDLELHEWVRNQRQRCTDPHRVLLLNKIGFNLETNERKAYERVPWIDMYNRLAAYHKVRGNTKVACKDDPKLYLWAQNQRYCCKDPKRILLLNKIGFTWETTDLRVPWIDMYNRLVAYHKVHGNTNVPYKGDDVQLYQWVYRQRERCKDPRRVSLLNKIGFNWKSKRQVPWIDMYNRLVVYEKDNGNTNVPYKGDDSQLYKWVSNQRQRCKNPEKILLLNKIGFQWKAKHSGDSIVANTIGT